MKYYAAMATALVMIFVSTYLDQITTTATLDQCLATGDTSDACGYAALRAAEDGTLEASIRKHLNYE
jgi:hypothetical protein